MKQKVNFSDRKKVNSKQQGTTKTTNLAAFFSRSLILSKKNIKFQNI